MEASSGSVLQTNNPEDQKIRSFVMNTYANLIKDIKSGSGDYLKSLLKMMNIPTEKKASTIKKLKSMTDLYDTVHEFTEEVIKLNSRK